MVKMYDNLHHLLGTPGYDAAIVLRFPNGISKVTPYVAEPGNDLELLILVRDFLVEFMGFLFLPPDPFQLEIIADRKIPFGVYNVSLIVDISYLSEPIAQGRWPSLHPKNLST